MKKFSGEASEKFWNAVNKAEPEPGILYEMGCYGQDLESEIERLRAAAGNTITEAEFILMVNSYRDEIERLRAANKELRDEISQMWAVLGISPPTTKER